jgi:hypothetical protein
LLKSIISFWFIFSLWGALFLFQAYIKVKQIKERRNKYMPEVIRELENCKTLEEIDDFLMGEARISTTQDKCNYLIDYMGIIGIHFMGGDENDYEFVYSILRESFCDGNWRLLSERQGKNLEERC